MSLIKRCRQWHAVNVLKKELEAKTGNRIYVQSSYGDWLCFTVSKERNALNLAKAIPGDIGHIESFGRISLTDCPKADAAFAIELGLEGLYLESISDKIIQDVSNCIKQQANNFVVEFGEVPFCFIRRDCWLDMAIPEQRITAESRNFPVLVFDSVVIEEDTEKTARFALMKMKNLYFYRQ